MGAWLSVFQKHGVMNFLGIDGAWVDEKDLQIPRGCFRKEDLNNKINVGGTFDLAVCLEVGEHLAESAADNLVGTLTGAAPIVLFSAAIPMQPGTGHINCQWPEYWAKLFKKHGFVPVDAIRRRVWTDKDVEYWYAQNTIIYVKENELPKYSKLKKEVDNGFSSTLPLVHPTRYFYALKPPPSIWFRIVRKIKSFLV